VGSADADKQGRIGASVYTAAKAAVRALARSMSVELLPRRIRVNVLSPGMTDTPIISREGGIPGTTPEELAAIITRGPLRRRGTPVCRAAVRIGAIAASILISGGFFGVAHVRSLRFILYTGAALVAFTTLTVGVALIRSG